MRSDDRFDAEVGRWRRVPTRTSNTTALTHGDKSNGNCGSSTSRCRTGLGFARRAPARLRPASLRIVWTCVQYAASVQYQRVMLSDLSAAAGVSERRVRDAFNDCHGVSPTAYLRVAALREVRRALLDGPFATRSRDPRRVRFRVLAPQSLCGPVPSVVRRITERNRRPCTRARLPNRDSFDNVCFLTLAGPSRHVRSEQP